MKKNEEILFIAEHHSKDDSQLAYITNQFINEYVTKIRNHYSKKIPIEFKRDFSPISLRDVLLNGKIYDEQKENDPLYFMLTLYAKSNNRQHDIQSFLNQARAMGLHGFIFFLPISIAFSQMCLTLFGLTYVGEALLKKDFRIPRTPLNLPLLAYVVVRLAAAMISTYSLRSIQQEITDFLIILVFFLGYMYIKDVSQLRRLIALLIFSVTLAASYGILEHFWEVNIFSLNKPISLLKHVGDDLNAPVRILGFTSYMTFSGQLAMVVPIIFAFFLAVQSAPKRFIFALSLILSFLALIWTYTRSAWVATVCALILFGVLRGKKMLIVLLLSGMFFISVAIFQPEVFDRSLSAFRTKENKERLYTWQSTIEMIMDSPLTGIGKGNYSKFAPEYRSSYDFDFTSRAHAHNNILQVAVTAGIPALLCFLWLWGIIFKETYRTYQRIPEKRSALKVLSLGFLGAMIGFFVQGFFEHNFGDVENIMMMWLIVAFSLKLQQLTPNQDDER